jgi:hypothetical protein
MVASTLEMLDCWYVDPAVSQDNDKTMLLSKLAILELSGWLEEEFDRLIKKVATGKLNDSKFLNEEVIKKSNGFTYDVHWRNMLRKVVGEVIAKRVDIAMEQAHPTELGQLKALLGQLFSARCSFAHANLIANVATQQKFNAPSLTRGQYSQLKSILAHYEKVLMKEVKKI